MVVTLDGGRDTILTEHTSTAERHSGIVLAGEFDPLCCNPYSFNDLCLFYEGIGDLVEIRLRKAIYLPHQHISSHEGVVSEVYDDLYQRVLPSAELVLLYAGVTSNNTRRLIHYTLKNHFPFIFFYPKGGDFPPKKYTVSFLRGLEINAGYKGRFRFSAESEALRKLENLIRRAES